MHGDQWICTQCQEEKVAAIREKAKIFGRYVDDILRSAQSDSIDSILDRVNTLHHNLEFTIERLRDNGILFLDMFVKCQDACVSTSCNQRPTDTGLILTFRALTPIGYKRNMIQGCINRIYNATSTWNNFHTEIQKAKKIWEANQYPPQFYEPIFRETTAGAENQHHGQAEERQRPVNNVHFAIQRHCE